MANVDPAIKRARLDRLSRLSPPRLGVEVTRAQISGVPVEWVRCHGSETAIHIIYFHGGGYLVGSPSSHRGLAAGLAKACNARVVVVDYRLAPEHPFPAAAFDAFIVYQKLLERGTAAKNIIIAGDSAGSGLALACALQARDADLPMPAALVCLSPWSDLSLSGGSVQINEATDVLLSGGVLADAAAKYLAGRDIRDPLASPQFADLTGLPPMLIQVTDTEVLYDDAIALTRVAEAAGVEVKLEVTPGMWHVWQTFSGQLPEADRAIDNAAMFISQHIVSH